MRGGNVSHGGLVPIGSMVFWEQLFPKHHHLPLLLCVDQRNAYSTTTAPDSPFSFKVGEYVDI